MPKVIIAIPSFRRPRSLARLLEAIERLETSAAVTVLVADNDAERHEAFDLCETLAEKGYGWRLEYFIARDRGIANVRNALFAHAMEMDFDFICLLDDDEWPDVHWLENYLAVQSATGADALHGAVVRAFDDEPGRLARSLDGISDQRGKTGPRDMLHSTANVLLTRACVQSVPSPWFDRAFALSGGEDRDFFLRLKAAGARFAWADNAIVHAHVPQSRASVKWAMERAYSTGNSDMRVFLKHSPGVPAVLREIAKVAGVVLLYPLILPILGLVPNRAIDAVRVIFRSAGKMAALLGSHYEEYSVIHGA